MQTQTIDKNALQQYILQGRLDCFRSCSIFSPLQGAAFHSSNDGTYYYSSGINFGCCNGIITDQKPLTDNEIAIGLEFFESRKLPFIWWTFQDLSDKGFLYGGTLTGIAIDISQGVIDESSPFKIRSITKAEELSAFSRIIVDTFGMAPNVLGQFQAVYGSAMQHNEQIHYLAYHDDIPVGTITLSTSDTSGIWNLAVQPDYRNKGIATALIIAALTHAKKLGFAQVMAILMPDGLASGPFTRLGFHKICDFPFYVKS